jgi:hypothetical protein
VIAMSFCPEKLDIFLKDYNDKIAKVFNANGFTSKSENLQVYMILQCVNYLSDIHDVLRRIEDKIDAAQTQN